MFSTTKMRVPVFWDVAFFVRNDFIVVVILRNPSDSSGTRFLRSRSLRLARSKVPARLLTKTRDVCLLPTTVQGLTFDGSQLDMPKNYGGEQTLFWIVVDKIKHRTLYKNRV